MSGRYAVRLVLVSALRLARVLPRSGRALRELSEWAENCELELGWEHEGPRGRRLQTPVPNRAGLVAAIEAGLRTYMRSRPDDVARNLDLLADWLGLDPIERDCLVVIARAERGEPLGRLFEALTDSAGMRGEEALAAMTGRPLAAIRQALASRGRLIDSGLVLSEEQGRRHGWGKGYGLSQRLRVRLDERIENVEDLLGRLFDTPPAPETLWSDFDHVAETRDQIARLLRGAVAERAQGVNILLYGEPGTGKTELCKALSAELGLRLLAVGEADDDGDSPSASERLSSLRLGQRFVGGAKDALILFDEMDDLLPHALAGLWGQRSATSRVYLHRILETTPVPTLWTANDVERVDPAVMRRMTLAAEIRRPSPAVRAAVWSRLALREGVALTPEEARRLAQRHETPPAIIASALRGARLSGGSLQDLDRIAAAGARAMNGGRTLPPIAVAPAALRDDLVSADVDVAELVRRLSEPGAARRVSFLFTGAPGTGKSAFARRLADAMGLEVIQRRASDLISPYVGMTERLIARAFAAARESQAFLVFDEADSFLASREGARHTWEVSQVNEMLTWMEDHPLPFACTTNLADRLDPASLRRFTFKVGFRPLEPAQSRAAFLHFFGVPAPVGLAALDLLTPGDYVAAHRRASLMGLTDPERIVAELAREQAAKPGAGSEPVGFCLRGPS
ncbi:AAA family ATPase [Rubellimicrobium mesophilum]|nr:ATP-binding protein [Rubellimicrobium mesophilum]